MTLPIPKSLSKTNSQELSAEVGTAIIETIPRVRVESPLGKYWAVFLYRLPKPTLIVHFFSRSQLFPMSFPQRLLGHLQNAFASTHSREAISVEWIPDFDSWCVRIFQNSRPIEQTNKWVEEMLRDFFSQVDSGTPRATSSLKVLR